MNRNQKRLLATSTLSIFLLSNVASAADHYILDGTSKDFKFAIDGSDHLTITESGGGDAGITIQHTTGNVITDATLTSTGDFDVNGNFSVTASNGNVITPGSIQTGQDGADGSLVIYSEQGGTDYTYTVQPNAAATQNVTLTLPADDGDNLQVLQTDGNGALTWADQPSGDDLGDHQADQDIDLQTNNLIGTTAGIDFTNFDVDSSGNVDIAGTLDVTQSVGIDGDFDINTTAFTVTATNGNTNVGGTLDVTGDFDVNSNFTVTAANGNTTVGGTLGVTGALTAASLQLGGSGATPTTFDAATDLGAGSAADTAIPTQLAVKTYVDNEVGSISANTLDGAYDEGGAGAGRTVTVDTGAVVLDGSDAADETLEVTRETSTTNTVIDAMVIEAESSGAAANNFGVGLVFNAEDSGTPEEQGSIDMVVTDVSDTTEESQFVFRVRDAGTVGGRLTVAGDGITLTSGATVDTIETSLTNTEDTHIPTSKAVADYLTANDTDTTYTAGDGITLGGTEFETAVDDTTIELSASDGSGVLQVKDGGIDADAIGTNAVTSDELADDAVDTDAIVDANVTLAKLAANSVDASKIVNDSILFEDFADATVLTAADDDLTTADDLDGGSASVVATTDAVVAYVNTYVAGEISSNSVFEPGDTGTNSIQADNGSADGNGDFSLAVGSGTTDGNYSFAYGFGTTATGADSIAGGNATTATGNGSVALGVDGNALSYGEVVLGIFADNSGYTANSTTAHDSGDRLFVLGNGTGSGARDNALVIGKDNDADAAGNWNFAGLSIAGGTTMTEVSNDTTLADGAAAALVTENAVKTYVDNEISGVTYTAGDGLTLTAQDFDVNVDDATIEIATDTLQVKDGGIDADAIGTGAVGTDEIADNTIAIGDIGTGAVGSDEILDGEIAFDDLAGALILTDAEDTGDNLGGGSATVIATTDAVKAYVDDQVAGVNANTLDGAYDEGGAGAGATINVDAGAVEFVGSNSTPVVDISYSNTAQNSVQNVAIFEVSSTGGAGLTGIGAGLSFHIEDGDATEEQASIDAVMTDVTIGAEESEIAFSVKSAGSISEIANVDAAGFDVTGNITATGTITSSSDATLKTNINPLENALASVLQLDGVSFDWIGDESQEGANVGVIAQNVQTVYPQLVGTNEAGLTVNYAGLVAPLIEAVKELKEEKDAEIEALQAEIAALQAQISE